MRSVRATALCALLMASGCASGTLRRTKAPPAPPSGTVDPFVATIRLLERSVCPVVCITVGQNNVATLNSTEGTAFFVARDGTFVTGGHVIDGILGPRKPEQPCPVSAIYLPTDGWQQGDRRWFQFRPGECSTVRDFDIARCHTVDQINVDFTPVRLEEAEQPDGTPVAFTGFPLQVLTPLTSRGDVGGYLNGDLRLGRTDLVIDRASWPGSSGSPVYLADGRVIGILLKRGTGDVSGITMARPARLIKRFLLHEQ